MNSADDIFAVSMVNEWLRKLFFEVLVANPLVDANQANFCRDGFTNELSKGRGLNASNDAGDDIALALNSADNSGLAGPEAAAAHAALVLMLVLVLAADEGFIDFDNSAELRQRPR